jgi:hypothetical protein
VIISIRSETKRAKDDGRPTLWFLSSSHSSFLLLLSRPLPLPLPDTTNSEGYIKKERKKERKKKLQAMLRHVLTEKSKTFHVIEDGNSEIRVACWGECKEYSTALLILFAGVAS